MTKAELQRQVLDLPPQEKIDLVDVLLGSMEGEDLPAPEWLLHEIRDRVERSKTERGELWEDVRARVFPAKA